MIFSLPHYAAPVTSLILALIVQGLAVLRSWKSRGRPVGLFLSRAVPTICVLMLLVRIVIQPGPHEWNRSRPYLWCCTDAGNTDRERLISRLEELGDRHLVIVRYKPDHNYDDEWVYNVADVDMSTVVFAREMDTASDRELVEYFKDRHVWLLKPDESFIVVSPYPAR